MWRPKNWENPYIAHRDGDVGCRGPEKCEGCEHDVFEAGADAMLGALWQMAKESPTGTFTLDSNAVNIYRDETNK